MSDIDRDKLYSVTFEARGTRDGGLAGPHGFYVHPSSIESKHFTIQRLPDPLPTVPSAVVWAGGGAWELFIDGDWRSTVGNIWTAAELAKTFPEFTVLRDPGASS